MRFGLGVHSTFHEKSCDPVIHHKFLMDRRWRHGFFKHAENTYVHQDIKQGFVFSYHGTEIAEI